MIHAHSLGRAARYHAGAQALVSGTARPTFGQLHSRVAGIAAALVQRGFSVGDRLALLLPNETEYLELIYACAWLGVTAVPLNTRFTATEIDRVLADATPRGLIRHSSLPAPTVQLPWQQMVDLQPLELRGDDSPAAIYDPGAVLALIYTSGTTGRPKGVALTHAAALANVDHVNYWWPFKEGGVYLHAAPLFHIADFPFMFAAPAFGTCQVTIPKFDPQTFCGTVQRERVSRTVLVPTMINVLTQFEQLGDYDLSSLAEVGYGGSPIAPELIQRTRRALPHVNLVQVYGLSETGFLTGLQNHEHTASRLLSCGRPCPGIDLHVVDESGKAVPVGQPGELVVRGENVMHGYWQSADETKLAFRDGMFRTGDIGYQDAEGFVYILDRLKDMIVTGGENVYSGEVESVLYTHPAVSEAAVFGIPDARWGELVIACVVLRPGIAIGADELIAHCHRFLAGYKVPRRIEFSAHELPKSGSGKILKKALRERFWVHQERAVS
jgi:acyl-CoA synthetase (AMP-forming)/AMP-acid ligase II